MPNRAKPPNPFQPAPGATPPLIVGREAELAAISDACRRAERRSVPTPLAFLGARGLGKTVLLNEVAEQTPDAVHLHIEVETDIPLATSMRDALADLRRSLEPMPTRFVKAIDSALRHIPMPSFALPNEMGEIKFSPPAQDIESPENLPLGQSLAILSEAVTAARKYLVVTIDEIQDAEIGGLRSLVARVHRSAQTASAVAPILLACAGLPEANSVFKRLRTYAKRWDRFELPFLTRAETGRAISEPIAAAGISIEALALDRLVAESAGYPYFVQRYASAAWDQHSAKTITAADVRVAVDRVRPQVEKSYYEDEFRSLTARERLFCHSLAELGPGPHEIGELASALSVKSSSISSIRTNLIKKGIVFSPAGGHIEFRMPLADRYVREHADRFYDRDVRDYARDIKERDRSA